MNLFRPVLLLSLIFILFSCSSRQKKAEAEFAGQSYGAVIPCADCEGIAYRISFYANGRFESSSMYIGESNKKFKEEGSWKTKKDSIIVVNPDDGNTRRFKVKDDGLLMLDQSGKEPEGKLAHMYLLENIRDRPLAGTVKRDSASSVDFKAHGNEPFWGLQINFEKMMSLKVVSGDSVTTPVSKFKLDSASKVRSYRAEVESGTLSVELHPVGCMDSMSGLVYGYQVNVRKDGKEYSGCGDYVSEKNSLKKQAN